MMKYLLLLLLTLIHCGALWSHEQPDSVELFQDTAYCNGKPLLITFQAYSLHGRRAIVGSNKYGQTADDSTVAGRIVLPDSVTDGKGHRRMVWAIGRHAFANCTGITEMVLPRGLEDIGDQAFYGCSALCEINLPQSLKVIYPFAFRGCQRLSIIRVECRKRPAVYDNIFDQYTLDTATLFLPPGTADSYANSLVFGMFHYSMEDF